MTAERTKTPVFYIVTPCLNAKQYIDTTITNIVSQAGEIIIYYHIQDGGSTDGTLDKLYTWDSLIKSNPPIINCKKIFFSWSSESDYGMYDAINKGFSTFSIPDDGIMAWCNTDDIYFPYIFACLGKIFLEQPSLEYLAGAWYFWENGAILPHRFCEGPYPQEVMRNYCCDGKMWNPPPQPSIFWKGSLWKRAGGLDPHLRYAGDYELWGRMAHHAECVYLPIPLSMCTRHDEQLAKRKPTPDGPTYYEIERERIRPFTSRVVSMQNFWKKRLLPPKGALLIFHNDAYGIAWKRCWPNWWGETLTAFFRRRLIYYIRRARATLRMIPDGRQ